MRSSRVKLPAACFVASKLMQILTSRDGCSHHVANFGTALYVWACVSTYSSACVEFVFFLRFRHCMHHMPPNGHHVHPRLVLGVHDMSAQAYQMRGQWWRVREEHHPNSMLSAGWPRTAAQRSHRRLSIRDQTGIRPDIEGNETPSVRSSTMNIPEDNFGEADAMHSHATKSVPKKSATWAPLGPPKTWNSRTSPAPKSESTLAKT